jgi:chromosome partitioning protein
VGGKIVAAFLANRVSGSTNLSREVLAGEWNEYGIEQLETTIGNRVAFAQALTDGLSIYDTTDRTGRAEIDLLVDELERKSCL